MPARPSLYSSPIQHVLVIQEEDNTKTDTHPEPKRWNDGLERRNQTTPPVQNREEIPYLWRVRDRMKTSHGALVLCLNIGFDPSDVSKPNPCAKLQCWIDPNLDTSAKSLQHIASSLKAQYERWQPKTRYKLASDPTVAELKRVCVNLRHSAKDERVLFHYNGHGVPKPTDQGEIWVFNHNYTHYIPFNLLDLHEVLGSPSLYIFDCNSAGTIFEHFKRVNSQFERQWEEACRKEGRQLPPPPHRKSIFLGACAAGELLPTSASMPADLFTSCLTTPLKTALHWFIRRTLVRGITPAMIDHIPGNPNSRHTPLGELNWIFTAITDTIAWNVLPRETFKKLYRQDMLLASLMRNFLLADRIMRTFGCHPVSDPTLPETHTHHLWESFELSMEQLLAQLPMMLAEEEAKLRRQEQEAELRAQSVAHHVRFAVNGEDPRQGSVGYKGKSTSAQSEADSKPRYRYRPCTFFEDQMRAFDVWLDMGPERRSAPEQLPIMLQVLLSPTLRIKALPMISRYLQTGPLAVDQALTVGIFPYVLRLLQSQSVHMRQDLVFIWSKILALDDSCRSDLVKDKGEEYFVRFLIPGRGDEEDPKPVYLAVAMFVLSVLAKDYADRCRAVGTLEACYSRLSHESPFVRRWACLCLTEVIKRAAPPAQAQALAWIDLVQTLRKRATNDEASDVRAAAVSTLSAIMNGVLKTVSDKESTMSLAYFKTIDQAGSEVAEHGNIPPERNPLATSPDASRDLMMRSTNLHANGISANDDDFFMGSEASFIDAPVPPFLSDERDALLSVGEVVADIGRWESSVLVRREIAIATARAVKYREHRFIRAAYATDVTGLEEEEESITSTDMDKCEALYRKLWTSLSELAYDPHPVIAALARRSYDLISEKLLERTGGTRSLPSEEINLEDKKSSPRLQEAKLNVLSEFSRPESNANTQSAPANAVKSDTSSESTSIREAVPEKFSKNIAQDTSRFRIESSGKHAGDSKGYVRSAPRSPPQMESLRIPRGKDLGVGRYRKRPAQADPNPIPRQQEIGTEVIHVRSSSGSFNLDVPSRLPLMGRIPRVNSASLIQLEKSTGDSSHSNQTPPTQSKSSLTRSFDLTNTPRDGERARSLGPSALVKGLDTLLKTCSQQFRMSGVTGSPRKDHSVSSNEHVRQTQEVRISKAMSPPRPPKRSLSYQVLNAATALSPHTGAPMFGMSRHTSYVKSEVSGDGSLTRNETVPSAFDRLYLSGGGDAALSLYEWSSAYISKVESTATSDSIHEEESIPRYAALWHKFTTSGGDIPIEDNLRAFARLGESDSLRLGPMVNTNEEGNDFNNARQLSLFSMGAGGGSITAMAFLPRDSGIGDDQLLATGDSTGSIGVYDIRTGKCQGSFGVPFPPGIPEVGVSSVLCLNNPTPTTGDSDDAQPNSRSALILAGAYDGRVAVFKSDFQGRKYRIMSTFQASGQSIWSKAGTSRDRSRNLLSASPPHGGHSSSAVETSNPTATEGPFSFAQAVRDSGNGLVLAFDADTSYLAAGGCDAEIVRVWDLRREQCVWEGAAVKKGTWPTALTMWNRVNPNVFVVGCSNGDVNVVDMREPTVRLKEGDDFRRLGSHSSPVISVGTCPRGKNDEREAVVAADIRGEIAFWEPRWNGGDRNTSNSEKNDETTRIKAHSSNVAAMAVHRSGRYVASGSTFGTTGKCVKIFGPNRRMVKMISHYERPGGGLFPYNNRISPVTSLTFQHETSLLAIGCINSSVMIYGRPEHFSGI